MAKLTVQSATLTNPKWPGNAFNPGATATMKADCPHIKPNQFIEFRIKQNNDLIDIVKGAPGATSATWKVPNLPHTPVLRFDALLKDTPGPKNGFHAVLAAATSGLATVHGFRVQITGGDASFVPHTEKIQISYAITDLAGVAKKGRYEIWGERYPDDVPLYTENFTPAAGAKTWNWDGKANAGKSSGKYISPEFSPYRVRIIIGIDQASVDDAFGAGIAQVAAAEGTFEVIFQSVRIRLQAGIAEAAANPQYTLAQVLGIEPPAANGTYPAMGRLPTSTPAESCRIRIPMACHQRKTDLPSLTQGTLAVRSATSNYFPATGQPKYMVDTNFYTRPEIPIEFELRLQSREAAKNAAPDFGVFDKEAVGPAKVEPFAEDMFLTALYTGAGPNQVYWRKAVLKIKDGQHFAPTNSGAAGIAAAGVPANSPTFSYWQARFVVPADGAVDFDLDAGDNAADKTYHYEPGKNELTLYLGRTRLVLGANQAALDKVQADYIEVDTHTIKLRAHLTMANDVLWVVRSRNGAATVPDWNVYPPGTNCHRWYGGVRGSDPTNGLFKKNYSVPPAGREPLIGKTTAAYPYAANNYVNLRPDTGVAANRQERVEVSAMVAGAQQGLAGVLFSPSFIAGDSYAIHAFVDAAPYERNLGWTEAKPTLEAKTGTLTVWRVMTIQSSLRLPDLGTAGLAATVGSIPEAAVGARTYIADGRNMQLSGAAGMSAMIAPAFNEWIVPLPPGPGAPPADVHKDINLGTYRTAYNGLAMGAGQVPMPLNTDIKNQFIPYDHYRDRLPPGIPPNRVNAAANALAPPAPPIAGFARGSTSSQARAAVAAALAALAPGAPDPPLAANAVAIPVSPLSPKAYLRWARGVGSSNWGTLINALTPGITPQPKVMQVIRWPILQDFPIWNNAAPMGSNGVHTTGFSSGDAQSFFQTGSLTATLFPHEMGHSVHLAHFVAENFCWKHHNILQADCMMSYNYPIGFITQPQTMPAAVGPTAPGTSIDLGWPDRVPTFAALTALVNANHPYSIEPQFDPDPAKNPGGAPAGAAAVGTPCIRLDAFALFPAPGNPCAKCLLKLRGWQELVLPAAWNHPDLF